MPDQDMQQPCHQPALPDQPQQAEATDTWQALLQLPTHLAAHVFALAGAEPLPLPGAADVFSCMFHTDELAALWLETYYGPGPGLVRAAGAGRARAATSLLLQLRHAAEVGVALAVPGRTFVPMASSNSGDESDGSTQSDDDEDGDDGSDVLHGVLHGPGGWSISFREDAGAGSDGSDSDEEGEEWLELEDEQPLAVYVGRALFAASSGQHLAALQVLLKAEERQQAVVLNDCHRALHWAVDQGHAGVLEVLLDEGVSSKFGGSVVLELAVKGGHASVVQMLLERGAASWADALMCLPDAARHGRTEILQLLVKCVENVNLPDSQLLAGFRAPNLTHPSHQHEAGAPWRVAENKANALVYAAVAGRVTIMSQLLAAGADPKVECEFFSWTPLAAAAAAGREAVIEVWPQEALEGREYGDALELAAIGGHTGCVLRLLQRWGDKWGSWNQLALFRTACKGKGEVVQALVGRPGVDVNTWFGAGGGEGTPLQAAAVRGHTKVVALLLGAGAKAGGQLGLWGAARRGHSEVVELLLKAGPPVITAGSVVDAEHAARGRGHAELAQRLHGAFRSTLFRVLALNLRTGQDLGWLLERLWWWGEYMMGAARDWGWRQLPGSMRRLLPRRWGPAAVWQHGPDWDDFHA